MNPVAAKQVALDNSLVPSEKRLKIEKCNARIEFRKPQREETYQVTLDALKLYPCYPAFLINAEVPEVYMHQFWNTIQKIKDTDAYRFKLDKKFRVDTKVFRKVLQIYPRLLNQEFIEPPSEEELVTFIQELGYSSKCISGKTRSLDRPGESQAQILWGVAIRDTPSESMPKKKTPAKVERGKGMDLLSDVALLEVIQLKKTLKKSKLETHKLHASGLVDGVISQPKVPDEQEDKTTGDSSDGERNDDDSDEVTKDDDEDDVKSDANDDKKASDSEKTDSDEDENLNLNQNDDKEEEHEEEYLRTPNSFEFNDDDEEYEELYKDVNVRLTNTEHEEQGKEDEEMTDVGRDDSTQQTKYEQVKDDEHVTLTTVHDTQKTEGPMQSSFVSFDFAYQFLNLDNVPPSDIEVVSMMNVKVRHEEPSTQTPPLLNIPVIVILETSTAVGPTISPTIPPITHLQQQSAPTPTPAPKISTTTTFVPALLDFSSLFGFDQRVSALEKGLS
ncbi:hypothetical protein Tco_1517414 [Tanacetum coccineum]